MGGWRTALNEFACCRHVADPDGVRRYNRRASSAVGRSPAKLNTAKPATSKARKGSSASAAPPTPQSETASPTTEPM